ncbi:hypothetical protein [Alkaliphilus sp. B6464]|uniref:hypothetical protein n=1 Tax=Alkaliphilus sp. B6464 TaxID=2731219 RepID=UPI001BA7EC36|nr:hypothetical protein [Alkaliphilus sp. B6464]QUH21927.1 hypothetical protein HYG84_18630 [Alkaliphilus sp. B6464]
MRRLQVLVKLQRNTSILKPFLHEDKGLVCDSNFAPWIIIFNFKNLIINSLLMQRNKYIYSLC